MLGQPVGAVKGDMLGLLVVAVVHAASVSGTDGAPAGGCKLRVRFPGLQRVYADQGYSTTMIAWFQQMLHSMVEVVTRRPTQQSFAVLPKRWIVARTFGWFIRQWRLSKANDGYGGPTPCSGYIWRPFRSCRAG